MSDIRERLAADNTALAARNDELSTTVERLASRALRDRERLIVAEQVHTVWLCGLAVATIVAVGWLVTVLR